MFCPFQLEVTLILENLWAGKIKQRSPESSSGIWLKKCSIAVQHCKIKERKTVIVQESQYVCAIRKSPRRPDLSLCALIKQCLWLSSGRVGRTQQCKCLIILLKTFSSNSNLVPYRHVSGPHPPIIRSKGNRALNVTKNKLSVREGEIIISFQKNKTLGILFHSIWCLVFDVNTSETEQLKLFEFGFFLYRIHFFVLQPVAL